MPANAKMPGATVATLAIVLLTMAGPSFAQQPPPATGPATPSGTPGPATPMPPVQPPQVEAPQVAPSQIAPSQSLPPQAAPARPRPAIATANVNLRSGPGTDAEVITTIPGGSMVRITSCSGEWCAVTWNGREGYAIARNLDTSGRRPVARYRPPQPYYESGPPVAYGPPVYYPPPVFYGPGYYYGPRYYYGRRWYRRW
jgi:uncharacterized protein YraI